MCGVVGIVGFEPANLALYDALTVLQHRGQDAAGIVTLDGDNFRQRKANGLVQDVFEQKHMRRLRGNIGIGHVRYPTAGSSSAAEAQPFYVNSPYGIALAHNGNLTNARELQELCAKVHRHVNTSSDSETLLNVFAWQLTQCSDADRPAPEEIFKAVRGVNSIIKGAYAVVSLIIGVGLVAFRDPRGIRPLVLGSRIDENGRINLSIRKINVTAPYQVIPEHLDIDVTSLQLGKSIKVGDLHFEGLELATPADVIVCSVKATRASRSAAAAEAAGN